MGRLSPDDITRMSAVEKLELIGDLWDSLDDATFGVPDSHRAELERRLLTLDDDLLHGVAWSQLKADLNKR
jgi:putative addiction module component (TIGR02574 family)